MQILPKILQKAILRLGSLVFKRAKAYKSIQTKEMKQNKINLFSISLSLSLTHKSFHKTFKTIQSLFTTLQVKVFAWLSFGNIFFWFRETFLQIKSPASKF